MKFNKLLQRQISKYIPEELRNDPAMERFLQAVHDSYESYERDNELSARAFSISEQEYKQLNTKLEEQARLKEISVKSLNEAIRRLDENYKTGESEDLIDILQYLKVQLQKRIEAEIEQATTANRLTSLIQNIQAGILVENEQRKVVLTNQLFCDIFSPGTDVLSLEGTDCSQAAEASKHLALEPEYFVSRINQIVTEKKLVTNEEVTFRDGRTFERDYIPVYINDEYKGHLWKYRNITADKKIRDEIASSEKKHRLIMNAALDAIIHMDDTGHILFWNQQAETIFGWSSAEVMGRNMAELIIPENMRVAHKQGLAHFRKTGEGPVLNKPLELMAVNKEKNQFPIELAIIPICENGLVFFCGFIRDISARKKSEEELKASEELLKLAIDGAGDGIWEYYFPTGQAKYSDQNKILLGYSNSDILPDWLEQMHPEDIKLFESLERDYRNGSIRSHRKEYRIRNKQGHYIWMLDRGRVVSWDNEGKPLRLVGTHTDITQEKEKENQLLLLSRIAEDNILSVVTTDTKSVITWANKSFCKMTGYEIDEIIGKKPSEIVHGPETNKVTLHYLKRQIASKKPFNAELINYRKDQTKFWVRIKGQPTFNPQGEMTGFFALQEDITKEKEAEKQIREFEGRFRKVLEQVGDNAWEHNFKTGITYFSNMSTLLQEFNPGENADNTAIWRSLIHPDDIGTIEKNNQAYLSGQRDSHSLEYRLRDKDGYTRWVLDRGVVIERDEKRLPVRIAGTHTDITDRKQAEQTILANEEKYRSIIANMNLGLMEVNLEEMIQYVNNSFCEMSGFRAEELIGRKAAELFVRGANAEIADAKNEMRKSGQSDAYEIGVTNKKGEQKWWLISGAPRYDDKGNLVGSVGIHLDITAQKKLELELLDARESAEQSAAAKEIFLANMSHEIRTPMNAIIGMGRQLQRTSLDEQQHFYLSTINKAAEHLLVLINDILDISKIEAGKMNLEHIGFRPHDVINHCIQVMEHKAEEKGLKLIKENSPEPDTIFIGDPYRLTQVLLNLLSNAIKFTEEGKVSIACLQQPVIDNRQLIILSVKDTGIGMDEEFIANIFRKFTQEEQSTARKYGGTGLGMSISKQLTELMKGHIEVSSRKGEGTTITLTIPFTIGTETEIPQTKGKVIDSSILRNKKILLVEDNEMNRLVATTLLENYGVITEEVHNGAEAVQALKSTYYDLVLMDVQMPVLNGLDATVIIRQEINQFVPIIALTANAIKGEAEKCLKAGMNDYISKPFEEEELINAIARWLGDRPESFNTLQPSAMESNPAPPLYDLKKLETIAQNNRAFIVKMINLFCRQAPADVSEIEKAAGNQDLDTVRSVAHRMKPSIDNMGISSLHTLIREVELYKSENDKITTELTNKIAQLRSTIDEVVAQLQSQELQ